MGHLRPELCPPLAIHEDEPELVDGYYDDFNGGCNSPEAGNPFGVFAAEVFCGVSGWYYNVDGSLHRDTDWFEIVVPAEGVVEFIGDAEYGTYLFELGPQNCDEVGIVQSVVVGPCTEGTMTIPGAVGSTIWFWVGPIDWDNGPGSYQYVLDTRLIIATESHSFSEVKALFE